MSSVRLSYVVQVDDWPTIDGLARCLVAQTVAGEVELVAVGPSTLGGRQPLWLQGLGRVTVVSRGPGSLAAARVAGVRAAAGDVVALGETHVAPERGWAEAALAAHDGGADVVLPRMVNANPQTRLSWAAFLMDYGRYAGSPRPDTPVPTYNATFRRLLLLELSDPERALTPGIALDDELRLRGVRVEPADAAVLAHLNVDRGASWVRERFLGGLLLGEGRRRDWRRARRAAYACASPLIGAVLLARALRVPRDGARPGTGLALAAASAVWAAGEAAGYLGAARPRHARQMERMELHKARYTRAPA